MHPFLLEEVVYVLDISTQEVQSSWVVMLHCLGHIDHVQHFLEVEKVVLTQIGMNKLALLVQNPHVHKQSQIHLRHLFQLNVYLFQLWGYFKISPNKVHDQDICLDQKGHWAGDLIVDPFQVPELLLRPHLDHLPRVLYIVPIPESILPLHIPFPVFEDQNGCFVYFDGKLFVC